MSRAPLAAVALVVLPLASLAEGTRAHLTVRPMAAPKPALKYLLLPEVRELTTGNPVQWYVRCFQEQRNFFFTKEANVERARYRAMPLAELPADKLKAYGGYALTQADWGARLDVPDWGVLQRVQSEGTDLRLAELGPLRLLAEALQVRFRGAVAGRRFDDAVTTAKTMFALARHMGECPIGAVNLLGVSVAELAVDTLEEMVQQPGCPNLYWALADLPSPLVDLRKGFQGDAVRAAADLRRLRDEPMTEEELEEVVSRLSGVIGFIREQAGRPPRSLRADLRAGVKDAEKVRAARARLIQSSGEKLSPVKGAVWSLKIPPTQALLLDEKREHEAQRDERLKLLALPPWQMVSAPDKGTGAFDDLLPDVLPARRAQVRLEQRLALLRHVEALRMYAAAHDGKLPASLTDCGVPLPNDPFSGKTFRYSADSDTATLKSEAKDPASNAQYQVTLKK
jgi:hypothetical protein